MVAIQKRVKAFSDSVIPARLIFDKVNIGLVRKGLRVIYEPMFKKEVFWSYIEKYSDRVKLVDFELVTPNMANISGVLPDDLKNFAKETNATKTNLKLESDPESHLKLDSDNKTLSGLVDYSSEGGGNISVKISGMKRRLQTAKSVKEIELADIEVEGNPEDVTRLLKDLMK
ncbi:hypothetical protein [Thalassospira sp.]|uniref:hypothetical protein n=1 Tax=Thalassospira sp. TaxID=1912094 RepID=UPI003AA7C7B6